MPNAPACGQFRDGAVPDGQFQPLTNSPERMLTGRFSPARNGQTGAFRLSSASVADLPLQARSLPVSPVRAMAWVPSPADNDYAGDSDAYINEQRMNRPTASVLTETDRQAEGNWLQRLNAWQAICARKEASRP